MAWKLLTPYSRCGIMGLYTANLERAMYRINRRDLVHALKLAIECQEKLEQEKFQFKHDSAFLANMREMLTALLQGRKIDIV